MVKRGAVVRKAFEWLRNSRRVKPMHGKDEVSEQLQSLEGSGNFDQFETLYPHRLASHQEKEPQIWTMGWRRLGLKMVKL
jgi:hypothetical protein